MRRFWTEGSVVAVVDTRRQRFEAVASEVADPVRRYALRRCDPDTAEDVLAETLLVVWRRLDDVPEDGRLPWCYAVAANCLANVARAARRQRSLAERIARLDPPRNVLPPPDPPDPRVSRALSAIRASDRELLLLWAMEGLSPAEIAVVLRIAPEAARVRLHRARARFAAALGNDRAHDGHMEEDAGGVR